MVAVSSSIGKIAAYGIGAAGAIATSVAGGYYTSKSVNSDWYDCIRPSFAPPRIVFPIVWTILYILLAVSIGTSLSVGDGLLTLIAHALNLILNVLWCKLFFADRDTINAVRVLMANIVVAIFIATYSISARVGYLFIPYIVWLCFAMTLNGQAVLKADEC
jgi:tryptophan-rich sensory protein